MKFYQLDYACSDKVNHTTYYHSYDKAKLTFDKLINQALSQDQEATQINWLAFDRLINQALSQDHEAKQIDQLASKMTDWVSVYESDDPDTTKLLDACIMTKEMI